MPDTKLIAKVEEVNLVFCKGCSSYLYKNNYLPLKQFLKAFDSYVMRFVEFSEKPASVYVDKGPLKEPTKRFEIRITAKAVIHGKLVKEVSLIPVRVEFRECRKCSRMKSHYFEGIFQLRNTKNKEFLHIYKLVYKETQRMANRGVAITKEERVNNGVDFYFSSQKFIQQLGAKLHKNFGGELKINKSLFTRNRQTSKDVFRVNVLFRLPDYNINDIITASGKLYIITSFSKDILICRELASGKQAALRADSESELVMPSDAFKQAFVTRRKPYVEVLHPETFQPARVENLSKTDKENLSVAIIGGKIWAVKAES